MMLSESDKSKILALKDVYVDKAALVRTCLNRYIKVGVIWIALDEHPKNLDILKLLLEHVQRPWIVLYPISTSHLSV